jgi:GDP-4-dehydro-6-deoxy-D-mannose reductase
MKALITGGRGFVGGHLLAHLEAEGDEVVVTDRSDGGPDLTDAAALAELVAEVAPEVVYHLAGQSDVGRSWTTPVETFRANVEGTINLLAACEASGVRRTLVIGSADVYGKVSPDELPLREDAPFRPINPYAASKAATDLVALQAFLGRGLDVVRVRPFTHIGPGQGPGFVTAALASRIARAERDGIDTITVGTLDTRRDFVDVRDVVRAYRSLVLRGEAGAVYNVCSGRDVAIGHVAEVLVGLSTRSLELVTDPALLRPADVPLLRGDPTRIHAACGWQTTYALADTLADVLDDWRDRVAAETDASAAR